MPFQLLLQPFEQSAAKVGGWRRAAYPYMVGFLVTMVLVLVLAAVLRLLVCLLRGLGN